MEELRAERGVAVSYETIRRRCRTFGQPFDEKFNGDVLRGLLRRVPSLDLVRVQDAGLSGADDVSVLEWAAREGRVLLTHDVTTLTARSASCPPVARGQGAHPGRRTAVSNIHATRAGL